MKDKIILLVEDDRDDEALTLPALSQSHVVNKIFVVRDGVEALGFLFCTGNHKGSRWHCDAAAYAARCKASQT
jgi:two-component system response regulator